MTELPELFDEAVSAPPPSRLTAADIFGASRARRRRSIAVAAGLVVVLGTLAAVTGLGLAGRHSANPPAGTAPPGPLVWAGRGDADHLYALINICGHNPRVDPTVSGTVVDLGTDAPPGYTPPPDPNATPSGPAPICYRLLTSSDAGVSWVPRGDMAEADLTVVGPTSLLRYVQQVVPTPSTAAGGGPATEPFELSTDGGITWSPLPADGPDLESVPPGATVLGALIYPQSVPESGIRVFDPAQSRIRLVTSLPDLDGYVDVVANGSTTLWATGLDRTTHRSAVAVSHDGGRNWITRVMPGTTPFSVNQPVPGASGSSVQTTYAGQLQQVISRDGQTAYAVMYQDGAESPPPSALPGTEGWGWLRGFETTDGGTSWHQLGAGATVPSFSAAWLTDDGRMVGATNDRLVDGVWQSQYAVGDGRTFQLASPPGLPTHLLSVDGSLAYTDHGLYTSADGWTWHQVWSG